MDVGKVNQPVQALPTEVSVFSAQDLLTLLGILYSHPGLIRPNVADKSSKD